MEISVRLRHASVTTTKGYLQDVRAHAMLQKTPPAVEVQLHAVGSTPQYETAVARRLGLVQALGGWVEDLTVFGCVEKHPGPPPKLPRGVRVGVPLDVPSPEDMERAAQQLADLATYVTPGIVVGAAPGMGRGVFADARGLAMHGTRGQVIGEYTGELLTARGLRARYGRRRSASEYVIEVGNFVLPGTRVAQMVYIDALLPDRSSWPRFINNNYVNGAWVEPNVGFFRATHGSIRVYVEILRPVGPYEQLLAAYGDRFPMEFVPRALSIETTATPMIHHLVPTRRARGAVHARTPCVAACLPLPEALVQLVCDYAADESNGAPVCLRPTGAAAAMYGVGQPETTANARPALHSPCMHVVGSRVGGARSQSAPPLRAARRVRRPAAAARRNSR